MKPVTEAVSRFSASNPFLLALLGLLRVGRSVDDALPLPLASPRQAPVAADAMAHELDLALLGLVRVAHRLDSLGSTGVSEDSSSAAPTVPSDQEDLLR